MTRSRVVSRKRRGEKDVSECKAVVSWPSPPLSLSKFSDPVELNDWVLVELEANPGTFYPSFEKDALNATVSEIANGDGRIVSALYQFQNLMANWKQSSGNPSAAEYEAKISEALNLAGEIRGSKDRDDYYLTDAERKAAELLSKLSMAYMEFFLEDRPELFRGLAYHVPEIARDILETSPDGKEQQYETYTNALVNFTLDEATAKKYGILYTSSSFSPSKIPVIPDGLFYEDEYGNRNNDAECQVAGEAFKEVSASDLLVPETGKPLTETLYKLKIFCGEDGVGKNGNLSEPVTMNTSSTPVKTSTYLTIAEHQVIAGIIIRMVQKGISVSKDAGVEALQRWMDIFQKEVEVDRRSIIQGAKADINELDFGFIAAVGVVTDDRIEFEVDPDNPERIF